MQRKLAFKIIYKTISDNSFTNLLMRKELDKLPQIQRGFVTNLVNGVLKNYDLLVYQHKYLYQKSSLRNSIILSMATYEKLFLNEKDYVVNNEYVNLAESEFDKKFINAVIHKINILKYSDDEYINNSLPKWIYELLQKQYTSDELKIILNNYKRIPEVYYRINPNKCSISDLSKFNINSIDNYSFTCNTSLINTEEFNNGFFYVQDINASKLIDALDLKPNDIFLDACSAPGSKLFNALEIIKPTNAYANDINEKRLDLIKQKANILGYNGVHYFCEDASNLNKIIDNKFDKILLDVPCSGLGVIGRRNDIKYHIKPENLDELQNIQANLLENVCELVNDNGFILYSTCTLNKKENSKQVDNFINKHTNFKLIKSETILNDQGDMFYFALLKKV